MVRTAPIALLLHAVLPTSAPAHETGAQDACPLDPLRYPLHHHHAC